MDGQTDRQTDRHNQATRQIDRETERKTGRQVDGQMGRHLAGMEANRHKDRQTESLSKVPDQNIILTVI